MRKSLIFTLLLSLLMLGFISTPVHSAISAVQPVGCCCCCCSLSGNINIAYVKTGINGIPTYFFNASASGGHGNYTYSWSGVSSSNGSAARLTVDGSATVYLTITSCCHSITISKRVGDIDWMHGWVRDKSSDYITNLSTGLQCCRVIPMLARRLFKRLKD